nr:hypothetical protein [Oceanococcus sp. HetDA_MAG_MS8]
MAYQWKHLLGDVALALGYALLLLLAFSWLDTHPMPWHPLQGKPDLEISLLRFSEQLVVVMLCACPLVLFMRWLHPDLLRTRALIIALGLAGWMLYPALGSDPAASFFLAATYPLVHWLLAACVRPRVYSEERLPPPPRYMPPLP